HDSLPQFNYFPLEIRRLIWKCCLPRRIAEEDFPFTLLDGKGSRQACWPVRTIFQNARVPILASVCREAREVVFEWGEHQISQDQTSLASIWIQPRIDRALHLNWMRRRNEAFYNLYDAYVLPFEDTPVSTHICRARYDYDIRISLLGDLFYPFDLGELLDSVRHHHADFAASGVPCMPVEDEFENATAEDLHQIIDLAGDQTIYVTLIAISVHVDRTTALASGLFGLLGDASVQTIDYDDLPQLHQFYELFNSDFVMKEIEPQAEKLFQAIFSPVFHAAVVSWQKNVKWLLQFAVWRYMQKGEDLKSFGDTDPRSVWTPPVPKVQDFMRMDQFIPNENYSWWREYAERHIPKVVPQVMVRLCDNQCHKEERRPEIFG
ncbi:hypothetical protein DL98DRAFT_378706, partial [Cadophora sp. DSE1049]